ncbi:MAG: FeoB-associated Cys-rich membrane protein [Oscillospiraceae bacterium]|nr:FeoB-associated Cys-rich membrane protein [Oscillospiraceae bacterium]
MNIWDISVLAAVALMVGLALWRMRKKKKSGCPGCCGCCGGCQKPERKE